MKLNRKGLIAKIHVAKKQMGLDDVQYQAILEGATGKDSCKDMNTSELLKVVERMESLGWESTSKSAPRGLEDDPQYRMLRALWLKLHDLGEVRDSSEQALAKFIMRQTKVERLEWLNINQVSDVIEALKKWVQRVGGDVK